MGHKEGGRGEGGLIHLSALVFRLIIYLVLLQFPRFGVNRGFSVNCEVIDNYYSFITREWNGFNGGDYANKSYIYLKNGYHKFYYCYYFHYYYY